MNRVGKRSLKRFAQISDLHFGRVDERLLVPLREALAIAAPELVVVSGDLTQRARHSQFAQAKAFLDSIPFPKVIVPGNHDIPLYHVIERVSNPLRRFTRWFGTESAPFYVDEEIAVVGFNTTWHWSVQEGRLRASQFERAREIFKEVPSDRLRVVVTHHPLTTGRQGHDGKELHRAERALRTFASMGVDLFLSGHRHVAGLHDSTHVIHVPGYNAVIVEAGTSTSNRVRGEENTFNVFCYEHPRLCVTHWRWNESLARFLPAEEEFFVRNQEGWERSIKLQSS